MKRKIICLCGSRRFKQAIDHIAEKRTLEGHIVLMPNVFDMGISGEEKDALDELHLAKISLADEIYVVNVGGYIGRSTRNHLEYAESLDKPIKYYEPV